MKLIFKIARTELRDLFYSPIAWLILIIFAFQSGMVFADIIDEQVKNRLMGFGSQGNLTMTFFSGWSGLFASVQSYLYLYIPLLTMGIMSRELGSGSIKLLFSSPVTNNQIILGKYVAMMIYGLVLMAVLAIFVISGSFIIKDIDLPIVLSGMLGVYLLLCAYAAIGLFMSSLTSYQIVAAVGTLMILAGLTYVRTLWQDIAFVRDITYWFGISGRANEMVSGMLTSEDILYFFIVIFLFLAMTITHLKNSRQRVTKSYSFLSYVSIWALVVIVGYVSSRPSLMAHYDVTRTKMNSLTPQSQDIVKKLDGDLTITTYVNLIDKYFWVGIPSRVNEDFKTFKQYVRFKPDIKMKYVYYYDTIPGGTGDRAFAGLSVKEKAQKIMGINNISEDMVLNPEQIKEIIDLSDEGNRVVRVVERENGEKTFLRIFDDNMIFPTEVEITAALKKLVEKQPTIGFLTGHGERETDVMSERSYTAFTRLKNFRYSLVNQGFDFTKITLENEIPEEISILVMAELREPLNEMEMNHYQKFIERGGNVLIIGEPNRQEIMNPLIASLGAKFTDGILVKPSETLPADLVVTKPTKEAVQLTYLFENVRNWYVCTMPSCTGIEFDNQSDFAMTPIFQTDSLTWNELQTTTFIDEVAELNSDKGEVQKVYNTGIALTRSLQNKQQRIVILGDADCISDGEFNRSRPGVGAANYGIVQGVFHWLANGEIPIDVRRPDLPDNQVYIGEDGAAISKVAYMGFLPGLMLIWAIAVWWRRRGR